MRTTIVLDDKLIKQAMRLAKPKTMREAVDAALRKFVARRNGKPTAKIWLERKKDLGASPLSP